MKESHSPIERDGFHPGARAHEAVANELLVLIRAGHFAVGHRLPSERQLASRFGVSRPTVRVALSALESRGIVATRPGSGTFVAEPGDAFERDAHDAMSRTDDSPAEFMETRITLEVAATRLAARRALHTDGLERVWVAVESLERVAHPEELPSEIDIDFHRAVVALTDNKYLLAVLEPLWDTMTQPLYKTLLRRAWTAESTNRTAREHRSIFEALRVGDPELAAFAMERHLRGLLAILFDDGGYEGPPPRFYA